MYIDNGNFLVNEPSFTQVPNCGYSYSFVATVASPLTISNNGNKTWNISQITDRSLHGTTKNINWALSLTSCTGLCTLSFSPDTVALTDLCVTTVLAVKTPFPYTM